MLVKLCCVGTWLLLPALAAASCWEAAGARHGVEPALLKAIAWKESRGHAGAVGPLLKDHHMALGLMQINSVHLPLLARFGIRREQLFDACTSQQVGAWLLSDCMARFGATWRAVGCYYAGPNSSQLGAQLAYVRDVQRYYAGYQRQEALAGAALAAGTGEQ